MKQSQKAFATAVDIVGARSAAVLAPDRKGSFAVMVCDAAAKKHRIFHYTGLEIPRAVVHDIQTKRPGFVVVSLERPASVNAEAAYAESYETYALIRHNPLSFFFGANPPNGTFNAKTNPNGMQKVAEYANEPPLHVHPPNRIPPARFEVKTRNCVDDPKIQENVIYSTGLGLPYLPVCKAHGQGAVMVSAGPSLINHLPEIKAEQKPDQRIVCAKHSHDILVDYGIVPWACVLLDPRDHVSQFVEEPHPEVLYFVSTTCHRSTFERLLSRNARVWLYNALVGAGEHALVRMNAEATAREYGRMAKQFRYFGLEPPPQPPFWTASQMVPGGTSAPSRGIALMHMLGFRKYMLFAYDSCYWERPDMARKKDDGSPRYHELTMAGKRWWTDAELVAQVQDFKHIIAGQLPDCDFIPRGDGMIANLVRQAWKGNHDFAELFA